MLRTPPMMDEHRLHPATRAMLAAARALARNEAAPSSARAEPGLADRLLVLERTPHGEARVGAFGEGLIALFGRDLRGEDFLALWTPADRALFVALLDSAAAAGEPGVARALGDTASGLRLGFEMLVTPLDPAFAGQGRLLALVQPLGGEALGLGAAIQRLRLTALSPPLARPAPAPLRLVVSNE